MSVLDILNGVQGGLEGGIEGYKLGQDLQDRKLYRQAQIESMQERADALRQAALDRQDNLDRERKRDAQAAADRAAAEADKKAAGRRAFIQMLPDGPTKRKLLAEEGNAYGVTVPEDAFSQSNLELPSYLKDAPPEVQQAYIVNGGKLPPVSPEMLVPPEEAARRAALKKKADDAEALDLFRKQEGIRQSITNQNEQRRLTQDDPALPTGARAYIAGLAGKYGGNYAQADQEFVSSLPSLLHDHPHMDIRKAREQFDSSFSPNAIPPKQTAGSAALGDLLGGDPGTAGASAPAPRPAPMAAAGPAPAPLAAPPAAAPTAVPAAPKPAAAPSGAHQIGEMKHYPNGAIGKWDGNGFVMVQGPTR